jgi:hypothetical protein
MSKDTSSSLEEDTSPTYPLTTNPIVRAAEQTRILVALRNQALDALSLPEETTTILEAELRSIGWPSALMSESADSDRVKPEGMKSQWSEQDKRSLLCLVRHTKAHISEFAPHFFPERTEDALSRMLKRLLKERKPLTWKGTDDEKLIARYEEENKSFQELAQGQEFGDFTAADLELLYTQATYVYITKRKGEAPRASREEEAAEGRRRRSTRTNIETKKTEAEDEGGNEAGTESESEEDKDGNYDQGDEDYEDGD